MRAALGAAAAIAITALTPQPGAAAEINVFLTGAARRSYEALAPQFEKASGHKLVTTFGLPPDLLKKADAGEHFDVLILSYDVEPLVRQGRLAAGSRTVFGRIGIGVAVRQGDPKPDFSTVEAFKRSLLTAKSIATSGEGSSGRYVDSLLVKLGIAEQVKPKIRSGGAGTSARILSQGEVDFVVSGLPPLVGTPNIEWLGYLPDDINNWLPFTGGIAAKARDPEAARSLLMFLTSPAAQAVWKANGLEPAKP
jgi:molybdate transport system substrate-binding protein